MTVRIRVLAASGRTELAATSAPAGERLMDALDEVRSPVPFSCRSATCGSCLVEVVAGAELLRPPRDEERAFLGALGAGSRNRLACRAVIEGDDGALDVVSYRI
jgi:ferredoxin